MIQRIDNKWRIEFVGVENTWFSGDSKKAVLQRNDTLYFVSLGIGIKRYISGVRQIHVPKMGSSEWIAYTIKSSNDLVLRNLASEQEKHLVNVVDFSFDKKGTVVALKTRRNQGLVTMEAFTFD